MGGRLLSCCRDSYMRVLRRNETCTTYCKTHDERRRGKRGIGLRDVGSRDEEVGDRFNPTVANGGRIRVSGASSATGGKEIVVKHLEITCP